MATTWSIPDVRASTMETPPAFLSRRAAIDATGLPARADGVEVVERSIGGVDCVVAAPDASPTLLYFHGGGYRLGSPAREAPFATRLAEATGHRVVTPTYRLAPEHPFPAGLHDALDAYGGLRDEGDGDVVALGVSAGGGLAAAVTLACLRSDVAAPDALVMVSPWLDLTCRSTTFESRSDTDVLFPLASAQEAAGMYLQGAPPDDPLVSPIFADAVELAGFPPTLVFASLDETLLGDSLAMVAALAQQRVPVTAAFEPGVVHAWPAITLDEPAALAALTQIKAWLSARA